MKLADKTRIVWSALAAGLALATASTISRLVLTAARNDTVLIPGFADIRYRWNRGISFSLFWPTDGIGNIAVLLGVLAVIAVLAIVIFRTRRLPAAIALGVVLGGALANAMDRITQQAVFDYFYLHIGSFPLFVCNAGDILISGGVIALLLDEYRVAAARR